MLVEVVEEECQETVVSILVEVNGGVGEEVTVEWGVIGVGEEEGCGVEAVDVMAELRVVKWNGKEEITEGTETGKVIQNG